MSAITPYQSLESSVSQTPQPVAVNRFSQKKWTLLKPQEELCKNLVKLGAGLILCVLTAEVVLNNALKLGISIKSANALDQIVNSCALSIFFTALNTICTYGYFIKSNREKADSITPEMKIVIRNQIDLAREQELSTEGGLE